MRRKLKAPTSYDVALHAGVSQAAVSRAFQAESPIAPATRERVLASAAALGYQPNAIARSLECRMGDVHDASNRVLERDDRKVRPAIDDLLNRVGKCAARDCIGAVWPRLSDGELAERAEFTLKCHAWRIRVDRCIGGVTRFGHVGKILTGVRQRPTLLS